MKMGCSSNSEIQIIDSQVVGQNYQELITNYNIDKKSCLSKTDIAVLYNIKYIK